MSYLEEKPFQFWLAVAIFFVGFLVVFNPIIAPFAAGFAVAYLFNPTIEKMEEQHIPRWASALVILSLFLLTLLIGLAVAIPILVGEMIDFVRLAPDVLDWVRIRLAALLPMVDIPQNIGDIDNAILSEKAGSFFQVGKGILGNIFQGGIAIFGFVSFVILMPIVAFYLMIDWGRFTSKINGLLPRKNSKNIENILRDIDKSMAGFIRGQLTVCLLLGGFYAIALSLLGLQYGFFIGVMAGVLSIIPYVGSIFGLVAAVGMALYQFGGWEYPLFAFLIFIIGQMVEGNYLTPKLVGNSVGLHPLWVMFALMAGGMLLGFLGLLLAVPAAAIIAVFVRHGISVYKETSYYKGGR